jgi:hypothetical protein
MLPTISYFAFHLSVASDAIWTEIAFPEFCHSMPTTKMIVTLTLISIRIQQFLAAFPWKASGLSFMLGGGSF